MEGWDLAECLVMCVKVFPVILQIPICQSSLICSLVQYRVLDDPNSTVESIVGLGSQRYVRYWVVHKLQWCIRLKKWLDKECLRQERYYQNLNVNDFAQFNQLEPFLLCKCRAVGLFVVILVIQVDLTCSVLDMQGDKELLCLGRELLDLLFCNAEEYL